MFGLPMRIEIEGFGVTLRPPFKEEMQQIAPIFSSMQVHMYTMRTFAVTPEDEIDWYEKVRKDSRSCQWGIVPDGNDTIVGFTGIHDIDAISMSCVSGIIIADLNWWKKGVATRAHLGRTLFAADYLNRFSIQSKVRVPNEASCKALKKVGYMVTGVEKANWFRNGHFIDTYVLSWLNPDKLAFTRPNGLSDEESLATQKANLALEKARKVVKFI